MSPFLFREQPACCSECLWRLPTGRALVYAVSWLHVICLGESGKNVWCVRLWFSASKADSQSVGGNVKGNSVG